jgi:aspartate/glutamate racemase
VQHYLYEELIKEAMRGGITPQLRKHVAQAIDTIAQQGADIIYTCSTIVALAEETQLTNYSLLRVDRPMAKAAVQHQRILVVAVVANTIVPTIELIDEAKLPPADPEAYLITPSKG